ncbi:MAG: MmcQ/YjbR family DNA-binding protein [Burkholderiales bacterium]|nr:MmcQ/YjbR family DNA-binding protein [Burkholderiales bacterium]
MNFIKARKFCAALPGVTSDIKWGNVLVYSIGGKMFAATGAEGLDSQRFSFKVDDERFLELTDRPGVIPAPYMARAKWIKIAAADAIDDKEAQALLRRSYELVFARLTKKLQRELSHD